MFCLCSYRRLILNKSQHPLWHFNIFDVGLFGVLTHKVLVCISFNKFMHSLVLNLSI